MQQELPADRGKEPVFLPSVVTTLVLIKDLNLHWGSWKGDMASQESHVSGGGSIGYGPFAVSGHYSHGSSPATSSPTPPARASSCTASSSSGTSR